MACSLPSLPSSKLVIIKAPRIRTRRKKQLFGKVGKLLVDLPPPAGKHLGPDWGIEASKQSKAKQKREGENVCVNEPT